MIIISNIPNMQQSLQSKHLCISAKVLYYYIMPMRDIISQSLF